MGRKTMSSMVTCRVVDGHVLLNIIGSRRTKGATRVSGRSFESTLPLRRTPQFRPHCEVYRRALPDCEYCLRERMNRSTTRSLELPGIPF